MVNRKTNILYMLRKGEYAYAYSFFIEAEKVIILNY